MKAIQLKSYGGPDSLQLADIPIPACAPDQVLIRTIAAGVNPIDWKVRAGAMAQMLPLPLPVIPGADGAGIIVECGHGVTEFKLHDEVCYYADFFHTGSYAEYIALSPSVVGRKPRTVSFSMAAALPVPASTAYTAIVEVADTKPGMRLLIHGAAGSVGGLAVQLAKQSGAYVIATASGPGIPLVKSYGADEVIDYRAERFEQKAKDIDVVLDTIGGATQEASWSTLKKGGLLIAFTMAPSEERAAAAGARGFMMNTPSRGDIITKLARKVDDGSLRLVVNRELSLPDAPIAQQLGESGKSGGKMILQVTTPPTPQGL